MTLSTSAKNIQADADHEGFDIDPLSGTVSDPHPPDMRGWEEEDRSAYYKELKDLQRRVNDVVASADRFDEDLAAAINAADGSIPLTPQGERANVNLADRRANEVAAFQQTYHRNPTSPNDWRMAELLDPHSYSAKNKGLNSEIKVARFTPQPGRGLVAMNAFIPRSEVLNVPHYDLGDNRGFDPRATPESSRANIWIDYDHGLIVARQNPSVSTKGEVKVGKPDVSASEGADGQVNIKYKFANPFAPGGDVGASLVRETVHGAVAIPGEGAPPSVNGTMSGYPAVEVYGYPSNGEAPQTIYQYMPGGKATIGADSTAGPLLNLPLDRAVGDGTLYPQSTSPPYMVNDPYSRPQSPVEHDGTTLGSRADPPRIERGDR
ncbi:MULTISPECIES: hypothetical protein [Gordonia]|uniref:hypothetical protein n=1 Tax=Gordonia TaxID=2053 RepID=UPI002580D278|nr:MULTISPECIES: hypothetical protein [Gordonia]